jgi:hypothetical protein
MLKYKNYTPITNVQVFVKDRLEKEYSAMRQLLHNSKHNAWEELSKNLNSKKWLDHGDNIYTRMSDNCYHK